MRRHASGTGCGARGQETNAPPALGRRRGTRKQVYAVCANANCFAGDITIPCQELADGGPLGLPEVLRQGCPKGASVERAARQSETVRQKARPGAAKTPRWRAERRHTFARRCDKDCMTRHRKSGLPDLRNKHARSRVNPRSSARHPLIFLRGTKRDYGLPGAAKNTGGGALAV
jgi:hypothetical protein